jgi:hypothetical protein
LASRVIAEATIGGGEWLGLAVLLFLLFAAGKTWGEREKREDLEARQTAREREEELRERLNAAEHSGGLHDRHAARRVAEEMTPKADTLYGPHVVRIRERLREFADEEDAKAAAKEPFTHTGS